MNNFFEMNMEIMSSLLGVITRQQTKAEETPPQETAPAEPPAVQTRPVHRKVTWD